MFSFGSLIVFLALMSPLVIFDYRHGWHNFAAIKAFFTNRETTVSVLPWKAVPQMWPILNMITADLVGAKDMTVGLITAGIMTLAFVFLFLVKREKFNARKVSIVLVLSLWLGFALLGLALYKQHIYDHYFGFVFTAPFIILGGISQYVVKRKVKIGYLVSGVILLLITVGDIGNSPLRSAPNRQLERAQFVAKRIEEVSGGERFNFALIAESNYESAYRYFLNSDDAKVVDIDSQDTKDTITKQLIVVCEREKAKCDPTHNAKAEVANFGWSKIDDEWDDVFGVTIYKLGHAR